MKKLVFLFIFFILSAKEITKEYIDMLFDKITNIKPIYFKSYNNPFYKKEQLPKEIEQKEQEYNKEQEINIEAVINKKVIINSKAYGVGDEVLGYKIITITEKKVKLIKDKKVKIINLIQNENQIKIEKEQE